MTIEISVSQLQFKRNNSIVFPLHFHQCHKNNKNLKVAKTINAFAPSHIPNRPRLFCLTATGYLEMYEYLLNPFTPAAPSINRQPHWRIHKYTMFVTPRTHMIMAFAWAPGLPKGHSAEGREFTQHSDISDLRRHWLLMQSQCLHSRQCPMWSYASKAWTWLPSQTSSCPLIPMLNGQAVSLDPIDCVKFVP